MSVYVVPKTHTKLGEIACSVSGPVAWNAVPASIRNTTDPKLNPHTRSTWFGCHSFRLCGPTIWNKLPHWSSKHRR